MQYIIFGGGLPLPAGCDLFCSKPEFGSATVDIAHSSLADILNFHAWYSDTACSLILYMHCSLGKSMHKFYNTIIITKSIFR